MTSKNVNYSSGALNRTVCVELTLEHVREMMALASTKSWRVLNLVFLAGKIDCHNWTGDGVLKTVLQASCSYNH